MTPAELLGLAAARLPASPYVVALSGGPDSAVLAWLACQHGDDIALVHINHSWPASHEMEKAARNVAASLDRHVEVVSVAAGPTETEARHVRLAALERLAAGRPVATGHHRDDDVETILGNLLRGAGATGLSGISYTRKPFVRPLLDIAAADIRSAADALELPYADDPENEDVTRRRNRIRKELLPALERAEPGVSQRLLRTGAALSRDDAALQAVAAAAVLHVEEGGIVSIPYGVMATAPPAVAARIVRRALRLAHPPFPGSASDVAAVIGLDSHRSVALSRGLDAVREGPFVTLLPHGHVEPVPAAMDLPVPGTVDFGRHRVSAMPVSQTTPIVGRHIAIVGVEPNGLVVRAAERGDRIEIRDGSKLVSDAMAEARILRRHRKGWPVVVARGRIIWLAGVRVAHWAAQGAASGETIQLVAERL